MLSYSKQGCWKTIFQKDFWVEILSAATIWLCCYFLCVSASILCVTHIFADIIDMISGLGGEGSWLIILH